MDCAHSVLEYTLVSLEFLLKIVLLTENRENHYVNWLLSKIAIYPTAFDKQGEINVFSWLKEYVLLLFSFLQSGNLLGFLMRLRYS